MGISKAQIKSLTKKELSKLFANNNLNIILQTINTTGKGKFVVDLFINQDQVGYLENLGYEVVN